MTKIAAIKTQVSKCILLNASLTAMYSGINVLQQNEEFIDIEIGIKKADTGYLNKIKSDLFFYRQLTEFIRQAGLEYDRIIFRYPYASLGLEKFTSDFLGKIVFEHNTKEIEELKINISNKQYASFSLRPSRFFFWFQEKVYPLYQEKYKAKRIFSNAHSGSCVTSEIAEYEKNRYTSYKTFVSSNFYNVSDASLSTITYQVGQKVKLGMIVSTEAAWYGLDRLIRSFAPFQNDYTLVIAGIDKKSVYVNTLMTNYSINEHNIEVTGKLDKKDLVSFYNSVHVCFGSLGLYNLNLHYASTLKVKESLAFGIPVVVGYFEEDFVKHKEFSNYYLKIANNASLIDFDSIKSFVVAFYADPENKLRLRNLALSYMDVSVKVKSLIDHIKFN